MTARRIAVLVAVALGSSACAVKTIVNKVDERQANRIVELLEENGVGPVSKGMVDTGRERYFTISVPASKRLAAIKLLNQYDLPHPQEMGYAQVFKQTGLIPTKAEEKAKELEALEGEIEKQLLLVSGILDVQVQIVLPDQNPLRTDETPTPTTASVTIKYMPGKNGSKPLSEPQVQAIVAAGVENLTPDHVVVVMTPSGMPMPPKEAPATAAAGNPWKNKKVQMALAAVIVLILLLSIGLVFSQIRLKTVRGRLLRLQAEIAKARRKPSAGEGGASAA